MKKLTGVIITVLGLFILTGCGGVKGAYSAYFFQGSTGGKMTINFKDDNKVTFKSEAMGQKVQTLSGTYDDKSTLLNGEKDNYSVKDGIVSMTLDGVTYKFYKDGSDEQKTNQAKLDKLESAYDY